MTLEEYRLEKARLAAVLWDSRDHIFSIPEEPGVMSWDDARVPRMAVERAKALLDAVGIEEPETCDYRVEEPKK